MRVKSLCAHLPHEGRRCRSQAAVGCQPVGVSDPWREGHDRPPQEIHEFERRQLDPKNQIHLTIVILAAAVAIGMLIAPARRTVVLVMPTGCAAINVVRDAVPCNVTVARGLRRPAIACFNSPAATPSRWRTDHQQEGKNGTDEQRMGHGASPQRSTTTPSRGQVQRRHDNSKIGVTRLRAGDYRAPACRYDRGTAGPIDPCG